MNKFQYTLGYSWPHETILWRAVVEIVLAFAIAGGVDAQEQRRRQRRVVFIFHAHPESVLQIAQILETHFRALRRRFVPAFGGDEIGREPDSCRREPRGA